MDDEAHPPPGRPVRGSRIGRPIMALLDLVGRRWTLRVMWELHASRPQPLTFRALQKRCEAMSSSVLNQRLRDLRDARLVVREEGGYVLTSVGSDLVHLLLPLDAWAQRWSAEVGTEAPESGDAASGNWDAAPDRRSWK